MNAEKFKEFVKSDEFLIFIFFLIAFTLFINWGADNSWSRYSLTESIVEDDSLKITDSSYTTVDKLTWRKNFMEVNSTLIYALNSSEKVFKKSSSVYSDKPPYSSITVIPAYVAANQISDASVEDKWTTEGLSHNLVDVSYNTALKMTLMTFTGSVLYGSGLIVLIFSYLKSVVGRDSALYSSLILGLGTPLFTYSSSYFGVINAAFFGFASFLALQKSLSSRKKEWSFLSGLLIATAFTFEYYALLFLPCFLLYLFLEDFQESIYFFSGVFVGSIPLMAYNYLISGNPFIPPIFSPQLVSSGPLGERCSMFVNCYINHYGFVFDVGNIINSAARLLFSSSRGLLFYSPILILSSFGLVKIYRNDKNKLILFPGIAAIFLIFQASRLNWMAGVSFGPRYVIAALPFLSLPLALGVKKLLKRGRTLRLIVILLFLVSCFNVMLGFNSWGGLELDQETYVERFNSFEPLEEGIYRERISNFNDYGPRSELLMSITDRYKGLDITYRSPYGPEKVKVADFGDQIILFSTSFIPVMILAAAFSAVFWRRMDKLRLTGIIILLIFTAVSINISDSYIQGETYRDLGEGGAVNGSMTLVSITDGDEIPYLELSKNSPTDQIDLEIEINGEETHEIDLVSSKQIYLHSAEQGENRIEINSGGCEIPAMRGNSSDYRCLSFYLDHFGTNVSEDFREPVVSGAYGEYEDQPWIERDIEIIFSRDSQGPVPEISLEKIPFMEEGNLTFKLNGETINTTEIKEEGMKKFYFTNESTRKGINTLEIESSDCVRPSEKTDSGDDRCLSYRLKNLTDIGETYPKGIYIDGWYESSDEGRWMSEEGRILMPDNGDGSALELDLTPYSELENNSVEVYVNGEEVRNITLNKRKEQVMPLREVKSLNSVRLKSREGCIVPKERGISGDTRCLSIYLEEIKTISLDREAKYQRGWYVEESGGYRWMKNRSYVLFNSTGNDLISASGKFYHGLKNSSLSFFVDGEKIGEFAQNETDNMMMAITNEPGTTVLRLENSAGCAIPSEIEENSTDDRCLSFRMDELTIDRKSFGEGWYKEEGDREFSYRWMGEESETSFIAEGGMKNLELEFKPYEYVSDPSLDIFINGESVGTLELEGPGRVRENLEVETEEGINELRLESQTGCAVPSNNERISSDSRCLSFQFNHIEIAD